MVGAGRTFNQPGRAIVATVLVAYLVVLLVPAIEAQGTQQGTGVKYQIHISCPKTGAGAPRPEVGVAVYLSGVCPVQAVDPQDEMGSPSIAVDPRNPLRLIMGSLHGQGGKGPTERSRWNDPQGSESRGGGCGGFGPVAIATAAGCPFTTFTSPDGGVTWFDNPFTAPVDIATGFGEHSQTTIDPYGHVYVGSLYSLPDGTTPDGQQKWKYVIAAQKFLNRDSTNRNQNGKTNVCYIDPMFKGNTIPQFWFLYSLGSDNMTILWSEHVSNWTRPAASPAEVRVPVPSLAATALAGAAADQSGGAKQKDPCDLDDSLEAVPRSVIGIAYTGSGVKAPYRQQKPQDAIGPCSASTNPVYLEGLIYIGCVASPQEATFRYDPTVQQDQLVLFRMRANGTGVEYLGRSPLNGGAAKLGVRTDGRLALAAAGNTTDGQLTLIATYGSYNNVTKEIAWSPVYSYADKVTPPDPGLRVTEANIQNMIYREQSGVIHMILKEHVVAQGVGVSAATAAREPHFHKYIVAVDERYGYLAKLDLDIGNPRNRTDPTLLQAPEAQYNDLSDGFLQLPAHPEKWVDHNGVTHDLGNVYQREFFAVGDYGIVQFAELVELTNIIAPGIPNPYAPPPPVPNPAVALTATAVIVPSVGISMAAALAALLFINKRKDPALVLAKEGK